MPGDGGLDCLELVASREERLEVIRHARRRYWFPAIALAVGVIVAAVLRVAAERWLIVKVGLGAVAVWVIDASVGAGFVTCLV